MISVWLEVFLGKIGKYIIRFIDSYYYYFIPLVLAYGIFLTLASYNLRRLEKRVSVEIVRQARESIKENPSINYSDLIERVTIDWETLIKKYSFFPFVSIESGLWVNRTNLSSVRDIIMQNERKIHLTLERHGIILLGESRPMRQNLYLEYIHRITRKQ